MDNINFIKMQGLGNDFVIINCIEQNIEVDPSSIKQLTDRRYGIGCDQLLIVDTSHHANIHVTIYNADGSTSAMCANGLRCVGDYILKKLEKNEVRVELTNGNVVTLSRKKDNIRLVMPLPIFEPQDIPISTTVNGLEVSKEFGVLGSPICMSLGNPHAVFFVQKLDKDLLLTHARDIEKDAFFPEGVNITFAHIRQGNTIEAFTIERGAGPTQACGSAACAVAVAAYEKYNIGSKVEIVKPGGSLFVHYESKKCLETWGATRYVFEGTYLLNN